MTMQQPRSYLLVGGAAGIALAVWNLAGIVVADGWARLADLPLASWVMVGAVAAFGVTCFALALILYPRHGIVMKEAPA